MRLFFSLLLCFACSTPSEPELKSTVYSLDAGGFVVPGWQATGKWIKTNKTFRAAIEAYAIKADSSDVEGILLTFVIFNSETLEVIEEVPITIYRSGWEYLDMVSGYAEGDSVYTVYGQYGVGIKL
jgi:hypothetical protein